MPAGAPQVSVIVPTRDRPERLAACLGALARQTAESFEVLVVDDQSHDRAAVTATVGAHGARLVDGAGRGPAAARNAGARQARGRFLCFTDDDCLPSPGWVGALADALQQGAAVAAGPTVAADAANSYAVASQLVTNHLVAGDAASVRFAPTCNVACRAELLHACPFDETFPLAAGEDREWCERLASGAHTISMVPDAVVHHDQRLTAVSFWRQQVRYGRGAYRFRRTGRTVSRSPARFYVDLIRKGFAAGVRVGVLVVASQCATAMGFAAEVLRPAPAAGGR
jgi:glycosyltransferase involved in cell wall biosynthesis